MGASATTPTKRERRSGNYWYDDYGDVVSTGRMVYRDDGLPYPQVAPFRRVGNTSLSSQLVVDYEQMFTTRERKRTIIKKAAGKIIRFVSKYFSRDRNLNRL